jgi:hypothetical protein
MEQEPGAARTRVFERLAKFRQTNSRVLLLVHTAPEDTSGPAPDEGDFSQ